jgi:hypothetical protein
MAQGQESKQGINVLARHQGLAVVVMTMVEKAEAIAAARLPVGGQVDVMGRLVIVLVELDPDGRPGNSAPKRWTP